MQQRIAQAKVREQMEACPSVSERRARKGRRGRRGRRRRSAEPFRGEQSPSEESRGLQPALGAPKPSPRPTEAFRPKSL